MAKKQKAKVKTNKRLPHVPQFVQEFALGGTVGIPRDPNIDLYENQIMQAKSQANSGNFLTSALDIAGMGAIGFGMGKMAEGIKAGEGISDNGTNWGQYLQLGTQALGAIPMFAMGGVAGENIEVEGGEIMETPTGEVMEMQGPSHEQGGIGVNVPTGTGIYSDRVLGADGKTMAQRKKAREKMLSKLQKKLDSNPKDTMLQKTFDRMSKQFQVQDEKDMQEMMQIQQMEQEMQGMQKFAMGGKAGSGMFNIMDDPLELAPTREYQFSLSQNPDTTIRSNADIKAPIKNYPGLGVEEKKGFSFSDIKLPELGGNTNFTTGEAVGLFGQAYNAFAPMKNTQEMRAGDTVNTNQFKDFGKRGLEKLDQSKSFAQQQLDNQKQQVALQGRTARANSRGSARSANTMRAMDIASNMGEQVTLAQVQDNYAKQMQQIFSLEAQALNQQDQVVMKGAQEADIANRQDRATYYSNLAKDIATKGVGVQAMGRTMTEAKTRGTIENTLNSMFPDFKYDASTGTLSGVKEVVESYPSIFGNIKDYNTRQEVLKKIATKEYSIDENDNLIDVTTGKIIDVTKL